ncbi:hypothetical protein A8990_14321 [Paenibacillus taihuensis]|uniref:Gfo/Idh/MocA-like oxidoreductase N-terminal domain-containing protein n=1 Tax=Paenibacillus taihuensis TaxID=1156355 RepID=A0A3D9QVR4_9BACL|nr:hypothetical protein [Paenibacillus taihuensis]REE67316.1 hypothetical protein A8990_14321 [Paenibacillus taihuensis]
MKTIGLIDLYLDEWHAEMYPGWIEQATNGKMKVAYGYGKIDKPGGVSNAQFCVEKNIQLLDSIEEIVEKSDYLIVLAPDHPEYHEELSQLPLRSGKPTYVDKTFAPDRQTAFRMFELARKHGTPLCSSSALRFASEYDEADRSGIASIAGTGPGRFDNYSIHQIEPIVSLMESPPTRVMYIGTPNFPALLIEFAGGKQATIHHFGGDCPFGMTIGYTAGKTKQIQVKSDFFISFIERLVAFFGTGQPIAPEAETIAIISIIEFGLKAADTPFMWVKLPS